MPCTTLLPQPCPEGMILTAYSWLGIGLVVAARDWDNRVWACDH